MSRRASADALGRIADFVGEVETFVANDSVRLLFDFMGQATRLDIAAPMWNGYDVDERTSRKVLMRREITRVVATR